VDVGDDSPRREQPMKKSPVPPGILMRTDENAFSVVCGECMEKALAPGRSPDDAWEKLEVAGWTLRRRAVYLAPHACCPKCDGDGYANS
jgi:hypothetical protein